MGENAVALSALNVCDLTTAVAERGLLPWRRRFRVARSKCEMRAQTRAAADDLGFLGKE